MLANKLNGMKKGTAALIAVLLAAACVADSVMTHRAAVKAMQDAGAEKLEASVVLGDYREPEQMQIQDTISSTEEAIRSTEDQAEIDALVEKAAEQFSQFTTDAEYTTEEGVSRLSNSVDLSLYREDEQKEIKKILESTESAIRETSDQAEIDALIEKVVSGFAEFKTDAEYTAEEEAARRAAEEAAAAARASKKKKSSSSQGCVGTGADVFN